MLTTKSVVNQYAYNYILKIDSNSRIHTVICTCLTCIESAYGCVIYDSNKTKNAALRRQFNSERECGACETLIAGRESIIVTIILLCIVIVSVTSNSVYPAAYRHHHQPFEIPPLVILCGYVLSYSLRILIT